MAGISIPGVNDKYKTNDIVEGLMKVERIPLTREQESLEKYKNQQKSWRSINQKMSSLRDNVKSLYSFDNPFNNKLGESSNEGAISATPNRQAAYESFKIDVVNPATADRFLSEEIDGKLNVPEGTYTYKIDTKSVSFKWKGGSLNDFVTALNKRGKDLVKASIIGVSNNKKALLIESLKTGKQNALVFEGDALKFAYSTNMIGKVVAKGNTFGTSFSEISSPTEDTKNTEQPNMPTLSSSQVKVSNGSIQVPPRSGFTISIPSDVLKNQNNTLSFTIKSSTENDITTEINENGGKPRLPEAGYIQFQDVRINNNQSETEIPESNTVTEKLEPITTDAVLFIRKADNTEEQIKLPSTITDKDGAQLNINIKDYPGIQSIVVRNRNTGTSYELSSISAFDSQTALGYEPKNAISTAGDAVIKYEGITITRPDNTIDDIVPNVTLHVYDKTEKTATISIKPDTETAKDALINFVGKYNQMVAEINILSQNKQEIIDELDYLSNDEKEEYTKNLGLFFNDMSLTSTKSRMQQIVSSPYKYSDEAVITMLSEIGISTNASGFGGYNPGKMRGYLEIDEKKLDENLRDNLDAIKSIFGYDSDGDLVIDSGIGYALDKQLTAYVQTGGILATKNSTLDRQIKASETKITKLESQLDEKEAQLRQKYGIMESTLNNLESQQGAIENFSKQNSNSK